MKELVFLLEEASAKAMLESLLPRILNPEIKARLIPFEGKQDLEKQMTKRMRGYVNPEARFVVFRDQDSAPDCKAVKARLAEHCQQAGRAAKSLVRIACKELETFYLADLNDVEQGLALKTSPVALPSSAAKNTFPSAPSGGCGCKRTRCSSRSMAPKPIRSNNGISSSCWMASRDLPLARNRPGKKPVY